MEGDKKYIELEAAKQAIMDYIAGHTVSKFPTSELCRASRMGAEGAMYELELVPAADVEEVRHGRWIRNGNEKKCSVCEFVYYSNNDDWNGCPNCLSKMDGK